MKRFDAHYQSFKFFPVKIPKLQNLTVDNGHITSATILLKQLNRFIFNKFKLFFFFTNKNVLVPNKTFHFQYPIIPMYQLFTNRCIYRMAEHINLKRGYTICKIAFTYKTSKIKSGKAKS